MLARLLSAHLHVHHHLLVLLPPAAQILSHPDLPPRHHLPLPDWDLDTPNENGGLTALEVWVLCNIGLVFFTFLAYVVLLARIRLETIRIVAPQKKKMDPRKEDEMQTTALEIGLFLAVVLVTLVFLVVFFVVYLINNG